MFFLPRSLLVHLRKYKKDRKDKKNKEDTPGIESHSYDSESSEEEDSYDEDEGEVDISTSNNKNATDDDLPVDYYANPEYHKDANFLTKMYLHVAKFSCWVVAQDAFNYVILLVIVVAGIQVGIETYESLAGDPNLYLLDLIVLSIFVLEMLLKIMAEGLLPYRYFTNSEWRWNWFDSTIVTLSLPVWGSLFGGGSIKMLRLIRLTRLGKIVRRIPPLQMIIRGILGGLKSCGYITLLQILVFYIFSVIGYYFFSVNDPFHFGSVPYAMFTLFRLYTLDNWGDFMFVNTYGCDQYLDSYVEDFNRTPFNYILWCKTPQQYWYAPFFCLVFILVAQMIILSLFIGAVSNSMMDSMEVLQKQREEFIKQQLYEKNKARILNFARPGTADQPEIAVGRTSPSLLPLAPAKKRRTGYREANATDVKSKEKDLGNESLEEVTEEEKTPEITVADMLVHVAEVVQFYVTYPFLYIYMKWREFVAYFYAIEDAHYRNELSKLLMIAMRYDVHEELRILQNKKRRKHSEVNPNASGNIAKVAVAPPDAKDDEANGAVVAADTIPTANRAAIREINWNNVHEHWPTNFWEAYSLWAKLSRVIAESKAFNNFVTFTIICAAVDIGFQTDPRMMSYPDVVHVVHLVDTLILVVFIAELVFKMCAEEFRPWAYFYSGWNVFDFIIVMSSVSSGAGAFLLLLRLLRLLRVLKLVKKLPRLSIIINAFLIAGQSIGWALVLLMLFHYVFGIVGLMLFKENDPHRFGSLHKSMLAVFRLISLDDSSYMAYNNAWGCDLYIDVPYEINPQWCVNPSGTGIVSFIYYITLVTIGNQILLSLFIGVLSTSLDQARTNFLKDKEFDDKISEFCNTLYAMTPKRISAFKTAFKRLDIDMSDILDDDKLRLGLSVVDGLENLITEEFNDIEKYNNSSKRRKCVKMTEEEIQYLLRSVDSTGTGVGLHIIGFIKFMCGTPMFLENERVSRTVEQWRKTKNNRKAMSFSSHIVAGIMKGSSKSVSKMNYKYRSAAANIDNFEDCAAVCIQSAWRRYRATHRVSLIRSKSQKPLNSFAEVHEGKSYSGGGRHSSMTVGKVIEVPEFIFSNENAKYVY